MVPEQVLGGGLGGVHRDVHGGAHAALAVAHRRGHGAYAGGELLVGQRPPAGADLGQLLAQLGRGPADVRRQAGPARLGERGVEGVLVEGGEQHLALRGLRRREAGADLDAQRDDLGHRDPGDVDDVGAVELRHRRGLTGAADEASMCGRAMSHSPSAET